ncbi:hypothetical protein F0L68_38315 [Solihabitans fulvus]|uniref:Peptidase S9 prolyl oligopeptidase catalytic domain-containing protein n=1 Tax=Solihabitans fulvus TaxID=1892852 RepID=A0A5B2WJL4_9PSEU|nr:hypothetical protein [Solihabitans fulvus]KAA2250950.1 hypothetical protein F0L68_38315 [Solihabitans fulvus]
MSATTVGEVANGVTSSAQVEPRVYTGDIDGADYRIEVPPTWNGTLLLYSHHYRMPGLPCPALVVPSHDELGPRLDGDAMRQILLERGYAIAGTAKTTGWMMEDTLRDQVLLHDWFIDNVAKPERTYVWGTSPGGLAAIVLAQRHPRRFDGALSLGADASGVINQMNLRLDVGFGIKTLLAGEQNLELETITDPDANFQKVLGVIGAAAQGDALAHARLILSCSLGNMVPSAEGHSNRAITDTKEAVAHLAWIVSVSHASVTFGPARRNIQDRAGGNPLWNNGVDYREIFARSTMQELVKQAYAEAGADLEADLDALNAAPRITNDPKATEYLIRTAGFPGLTPVPVVTMHTTRDGAAPVEHERALADRVALVGDPDRLVQLYIDRNFTCAFSPAEVITALDLLEERARTGKWGDTSAEALNATAAAYPAEQRRVYNFWIPQEREDERFASLDPAFVEFEPEQLQRTYPF